MVGEILEKYKRTFAQIFLPREVVEKICEECGVLGSFRACEDLWKKIEESGLYFGDNLLFEVGKIFSSLKPFSYRRVVIPLMEGDAKKALVVGSSIYVGDYVKIAYLRRRYAPQEVRLAKYIIEYADEIRPYVRRSIREDFSELCELARKLRFSPPHIEISRKGDFRVWDVGRKIIAAWKCDEFLLESFAHSTSFILVMRKSGKVRRYILPADTKFMLRDVLSPIEHYDVLHEMFREYYDKLSDAAESNSGILREMREIAAPYILSENV